MTSSTDPTRTQLTDEIEPTANGRHLLITILAILIILILVNLASIWFLDKYPYNRGYWLVKAKWELLQTMEQPIDWLVVGDSSGNQGFDPTVFEREMAGQTAVNLATVADMGTVDDAWMLQTYIERFGPPSNLILIHTFDSWHRDLQFVFIGKSAMPWGSWNSLQPNLNFTFAQQRDIFLARFVPLYADNQSLSKSIMDATLTDRPLFANRYHLEPDGFMRHPAAAPARVERHALELIQFVDNRRFTMSEANQASIATLITLADQYNIQLYFVSAPLYEGLANDEQFQAYYNQILTTLNQLSQGSDNVHVLETIITFPADQMESPDHIMDAAAERYTSLLAAAIQNTP